jgi:hypothetical protein
MRVLALVGAALFLLVAAPVRTAVAATPLLLHPPALLGATASPALAGPEGAGLLPARGLDHMQPDMLILGLGLMAGGIVAGAAGFTLLYLCDPVGQIGCYDQALNVTGWVLAAPGILPLAIGGILVYIAVNSPRRYSAAPPRALTAMYVSPVPGGAMVGTTLTF